MSPTTTYLITGASRGLGLEYTRQLLAHSSSIRVVATARNPGNANQLQEIAGRKENEGRVHVIKLDVGDEKGVKEAVAELERSSFIGKGGIDALINNAGVLAGGNKTPLQASTADLRDNFETNVLGVVNTTLALLPLLRKGEKKQIFNLSSSAGSFGTFMATVPSVSSYACSKVAVNMWLLKLSHELHKENFTVVPFHPGYVKTDMNGGPEGKAELTVEEAASLALKNVFLKATFADNGKFLAYDGVDLPW